MICPHCRRTYRRGATECPDCRVPLVEKLLGDSNEASQPLRSGPPDPVEQRSPLDLVTVLQTGDFGLIAIAQSLLRSADVPFIAEGEAIRQLWGGYSPFGRGVALKVRREDADDATAILRDLRSET
jgi:hypothetical protein